MIRKIKILCAVLLCLPLIFTTCNKLDAPDRNSDTVLTVAMDLDLPGYFLFGEQPLGYPYEVLESYAASQGKTLHVVSDNTPAAYLSQLTADRLDLAVVYGNPVVSDHHTALSLYETSYVVLSSRTRARTIDARTSIYETLSDSKVLMSQGFTTTKNYHELLDSVSRSELFLSGQNTFDLFDALLNDDCDFVICELTEAQLGCSLIRNMASVHTFDEAVPVRVVVSNRDIQAATRFTDWLANYRMTDEYAEVYEDYFEKGISNRLHSHDTRTRTAGSISGYDNLFRQVGSEERVDWRMMSAIASVESRFNNYLVSKRGARGLMQVMPRVAESLGVDPENLMEPETNLRVAAKVIRRIGQSLKISENTHFTDQASLMLAAYNGGIGNIMDARRLAEKYGADPDSWADVSRFLNLMAEDHYAEDEVVQCGGFKGASETLAFVDKVMDNYYAYGGTGY